MLEKYSVQGMEIPEERRTKILKYLKQAGCKPTVSGYMILLAVISLSVDDPTLNCQALFYRYIGQFYEHPTQGDVRAAYRAARYCILNSDSGERSVYSFIRTCAVELALL